MCCGGYRVGPVADDVAARIEAHPFRENADRIAAAGGPFRVAEVDGRPLRALAQFEGRCVFLGEDGLCVVHRELGADAKPALCRMYPLNVAIAPDGIAYVSLNMECAGYARGQHGPPLEETVLEHIELLGGLPGLVVPETVVVAPGRTLSYDAAFDQLEAPWQADLLEPRAPAALLADLCARLWTGSAAPGAPGWTPAPALAEVVAAWAGEDDAANAVDAGYFAELAGVARRAISAGTVGLGTAPGDPSDHLLRTHLEHLVFGKSLHRAPSLAAGLGFERLKLWMVAAEVERLGPGDETLVDVLRVVNRTLRHSDLALLGAAFTGGCVTLSQAA
jgi:Fe-S-cluster containining protein